MTRQDASDSRAATAAPQAAAQTETPRPPGLEAGSPRAGRRSVLERPSSWPKTLPSLHVLVPSAAPAAMLLLVRALILSRGHPHELAALQKATLPGATPLGG